MATVFKLSKTGKETMLHSFKGGVDGASPQAAVVRDAAGNLYGTTDIGGTYHARTVQTLPPAVAKLGPS